MKKFFKYAFLIVFLIAVFSVIFKDRIIKHYLVKWATEKAGTQVIIDDLKLNILNGSVQIENFRIQNPSRFPEGTLLYMPLIRADFDVQVLKKKKLHLRSLTFSIEELNIIKNKEGTYNYKDLNFIKKGDLFRTENREDEGKPLFDLPVIENLKVTLGRITYRDQAKKKAVIGIDFRDKSYENISSLKEIVPLILTDVIKHVTISRLEMLTGAPVKIKNVKMGLATEIIEIEGLKIGNPQGFPKEIFLDVPLIRIDFDLSALLKKEIHLKHLEITIKTINIIADKEGNLNVDALAFVKEYKEASEDKSGEEEPLPEILVKIDRFTFSVDKLISNDYSGNKHEVKVYNVGIKRKTYKNIPTGDQIFVLILTDAMKKTAIKGAYVYGLAQLLGVGMWEAWITNLFADRRADKIRLEADFDKVFDRGVDVLKELGKVNKQKRKKGYIRGKVRGCRVIIRLKKTKRNVVEISVLAKKILQSKPEIAAGVLYEIEKAFDED